MNVTTDPNVFSEPDNIESIIAFLRLVIDGRHFWVVDPVSEERATIFFEKWIPGRSAAYRQIMQKSFAAAVVTGAGSGSAARMDASIVDDLVSDLSLPAVVVVENAESDGRFLQAVCDAFQHENLRVALAQRWLEVRQSGGSGEIVKVATDCAKSYRTVTRVRVFLDSDRLAPNQVAKCHRTADRLRAVGIDVHVLKLREVENYIPERALASHRDTDEHQRKVAALGRLRPDQRGHFDMKHGLAGRRWKPAGPVTIDSGHGDLFDNLDAATALDLAQGFGKDILGCIEDKALRLTPSDFASLGPGVDDELRRLLDLINEVV